MNAKMKTLTAVIFLLTSFVVYSQQVSIIFPTSRVVYQRDANNSSTFSIQGTYTGGISRIEARLIPAFSGQGVATSWTTIVNSPSGGSFTGNLSGNGGWYNLEVRTMSGSTVMAQTVVEKVGIGEVFIVSGQSNAEGNAGYPGAVRGATDDRVSTIDYFNIFFDDSFLPFEYVHDGDYMRKAPYNPVPWYWSRLGDKLVNRFNVPVCFYGAALGGSQASWWSRSADGEDLRSEYIFHIKVAGLPYIAMKSAIQKYGFKTGFRAILWHQGEGDINTSDTDYYNRIRHVIEKTRADGGDNNIAWVVSRVMRVAAQTQLAIDLNQVYVGPYTDTIDAPGDRINGHFQLNGLNKVANAWDLQLNSNFFNNSIPQLPKLILGNPNKAPIAKFTVNQTTGGNNFIVNFNSSTSSDVDGFITNYNWLFDEYGNYHYQPSNQANPSVNYIESNSYYYTTSFKVTDNNGQVSASTRRIGVNNVAPIISATSVDAINFIPPTGTTLNLSATISDPDHPFNQLYPEWSVTPYLNGLPQPQPAKTHYGHNTSVVLPAVNCSAGTQFFRVKLAVTDSLGIQSVFTKDIYPFCVADNTPPTQPSFVSANQITVNSVTLTWGASTDNFAMSGYQIYRDNILIATVNSNTTTFNATSLATNTNYRFMIKAIDVAGNQAESSPLTVKTAQCVGTNTFLSDLNWASMSNGFGNAEKDKSNGEGGNNDGNTITLNGITYTKGLGVHANSTIIYNLNGQYNRFRTDIGLDDEVDFQNQGSVVFKVYTDNNLVYTSPTMTKNSITISLNIDVSGINQLKLEVTDSGDNMNYDHADWANARLETLCGGGNDTVAPSVVNNLVGANFTNSSFQLSWNPATDNIGVVAYDVYLNGVLNTTVNTSSTNLTVNINQNAKVTIQSRDAAGNTSVGASFTLLSGNQPCQSIINITNSTPIIGTLKFEASENITATNRIYNSMNLTYDAAKSVLLNPGFRADNGSVFRANIDGCGGN
jgi:chitodextrinase